MKLSFRKAHTHSGMNKNDKACSYLTWYAGRVKHMHVYRKPVTNLYGGKDAEVVITIINIPTNQQQCCHWWYGLQITSPAAVVTHILLVVSATGCCCR